MRFSRLWLSGIVVLSFMVPGAAAAQQAPPRTDAKVKKGTDTKGQANTASEKKSRKKRPKQPRTNPKVQHLEELVVIGRIQKPEVFYVLGRTSFNYRGLNLKRSFVDRIGRSVRGNPF